MPTKKIHISSDSLSSYLIKDSSSIDIIFDTPIHKDITILINCNQNADIKINNLFLTNNCKSNIDIKILGNKNTHVNVIGIIEVPKNKTNIISSLNMTAFILNKEISIKMSPMLKISSKNVEISHSAKTFFLNEEQYFYLYTKAFDNDTIKSIITESIFNY